MDLLKKVKSATLVETLVATVLILVLFVISSLIINSIFQSNLMGNTSAVEKRMNELEYEFQSKKIEIPYAEDFKNWEVSIEKIQIQNRLAVRFTAVKTGRDKYLEYLKFYVE